MSKRSGFTLELTYGRLVGSTFIPRNVGLAKYGPTVQVGIGFHEHLVKKYESEKNALPPLVVGNAMLDTGATITTIDSTVAQQLNLRQSGQVESFGIGGKSTGYTVACSVNIKGLVVNIPRAHCHELAKYCSGLVALIGRDVLTHMVLNYDGPNGVVTLTLPVRPGTRIEQTPMSRHPGASPRASHRRERKRR